MKKGKQDIIVVGDRVLIIPDVGEERSNTGLYLPKWALERETVQGGRIVEIGPGIPLANPTEAEDEPWKKTSYRKDDTPQQAKVGDYAIFLRKTAVEFKLEGDTFLVVPQAGLLVLIRDSD